MNHSQSLPSISNMYKLVNGKDDSWGLEFYSVNKTYQDPIKSRIQRQTLSNKNVLKKSHITKKGLFLDDICKLNKNPGPGTYQISSQLGVKSQQKSFFEPKKSYIDEIISYQNKNKFPGSNKYQICQSDQKLKERLHKLQQKKIKYSEKLTYFDNCQYQSQFLPGPGTYNPHQIKQKLKQNHVLPSQIRKIDIEKSLNPKKINQPTFNSYNPLPVNFQLFEKRRLCPNKYTQKKNGWGTQTRENNNKIKQNVSMIPGPGEYNTCIIRCSKDRHQKQNNCFKVISTGIMKSVYY